MEMDNNIGAMFPLDIMLENGKIGVVIAVVCVIISGLFIYLFTLDRKIVKLEKEQKERQQKK